MNHKTKILLVDDESEFTEALEKRLTARGLQIDTVHDGTAAVEKVKTGDYAVVVLDLAMPGIDGIETLHRIREVEAHTQVILLTAYGSIDKGIVAMKLGAFDFLEKPADFHVLLTRIHDASRRAWTLVDADAEASASTMASRDGR